MVRRPEAGVAGKMDASVPKTERASRRTKGQSKKKEPGFLFRRRVGRVDWRLVSAIDPDAVCPARPSPKFGTLQNSAVQKQCERVRLVSVFASGAV